MKKTYITPSMVVMLVNQTDGILLTASEGGQNLLGDGGNTEGTGITSGDVKAGHYNVWNDDWSAE